MNSWIAIIKSPVILLYQDFLRFRNAKNYELKITPQVCYMQKLLNDRFDFINRRIIIVDGLDKPPTFIYKVAEIKPVFIYLNSQSLPHFIYTSGESSDIHDDFIIQIPMVINFDAAEMISLTKVFKLAGAKFKIQRV